MDRMKPIYSGVGYIGCGKHDTRGKYYLRWRHMLARCYDKETQASMPTYAGCKVAEIWHDYQNYAEWCESNAIPGGEVDKDILIEGNKIYSPETCMFVTHQQNTEKSTAKTYLLLSPKAKKIEVYNLNKFCKENNLSSPNMRKVYKGLRDHHKGWRVLSVHS